MDITKRKIIDLAALPVGKARSQAIVCIGATIACMLLAVALIAVGAYLPLMFERVTPIIVWVAMGMTAGGIGMFALSRWISRNALAKED